MRGEVHTLFDTSSTLHRCVYAAAWRRLSISRSQTIIWFQLGMLRDAKNL